MKIVIQYANSAPYYIRLGWIRAFNYCGHKATFWNKETTPIFDIYNHIDPDLLICNTYDVDEAVVKCIKSYPEAKVAMFASAWGPLVDNLSKEVYPIVKVSDEEKRLLARLKRETGKPDYVFIHVTDKYLNPTMEGWRSIGIEPVGILNGADVFEYLGGRYKEEYASDISFIGSRWPYKSRNLDKYFGPLCDFPAKLKIKIWGNGGWVVPQYLGRIKDEEVKHIFASATACPNASESHSTDLGFDLVERIFKVPLSGFLVSDKVAELSEVFKNNEVPTFTNHKELAELVDYYGKALDERNELMVKQKDIILKGETYFHRCSKMLAFLGLKEESDNVLKQYDKLQ